MHSLFVFVDFVFVAFARNPQKPRKHLFNWDVKFNTSSWNWERTESTRWWSTTSTLTSLTSASSRLSTLFWKQHSLLRIIHRGVEFNLQSLRCQIKNWYVQTFPDGTCIRPDHSRTLYVQSLVCLSIFSNRVSFKRHPIFAFILEWTYRLSSWVGLDLLKDHFPTLYW